MADDDDDNDVASSDSELQVQDPSRDIEEPDTEEDPMKEYTQKEAAILHWLESNPGQRWIDHEFPASSVQFYAVPERPPEWAISPRSIEWRRPQEISKDAKFLQEESLHMDIEIRPSVFHVSTFADAVALLAAKPNALERLIVEKSYFDRGFVAFQFFKNGKWVQVVVDTMLPFENREGTRKCVYAHCANTHEFWMSLMEKAYSKLHGSYERSTMCPFPEIFVDLTGALADLADLNVRPTIFDAHKPPPVEPHAKKTFSFESMSRAHPQPLSMFSQSKSNFNQGPQNQNWELLLDYFHQRFTIGCIKSRRMERSADHLGIAENRLYTLIDMREFPKENLRLVRLHNVWGAENVWTGPFCEEADDWEKFKAIREELKHAPKMRRSDFAWWMTFSDFLQHFATFVVGRVFPENWQSYSIEGVWAGKTNGGRSPIGPPEKAFDKATSLTAGGSFLEKNQIDRGLEESGTQGEHVHPESDDRWFNNPQYRIRVVKDTKVYISLMQEDERIVSQPYVSVGYMLAGTRSRTERFWERPVDSEIVAEVNYTGALPNQRELTQQFLLRKGAKGPRYYLIVPNINEAKETKKEEARRFFLRVFASEEIEIDELAETLETVVEGQWTEASAGGPRKLCIRDEVKKRLETKDNPNWCKNPQYFIALKEPTIVKAILRRAGAKKFKGWKIGMTVCRCPPQVDPTQELLREKQRAGHSLKKLLQQTSAMLQPPPLVDIERKLRVEAHEKFWESGYVSEECSALLFRWTPMEGPFVIVPSSDGEDRQLPFKLTLYSNRPLQLIRLDDIRNQVVVGRWEKDISAGGCHLTEKEKEASQVGRATQRTWSMNPKFHLTFREEWEESVNLKITLTIAERNWKRLNPSTVSGMIGIYLLERREGKLSYSEDIVVAQTSFLPVKSTTLSLSLGEQKPFFKAGYIVMPTTYEPKVQGAFLLSVQCDCAFDLTPIK